MALSPAAEAAIRNAAPNRGRLGSHLVEALIHALRTASVVGDVPTPQVILKAAVTETAASHIVYAAACRLYAVFVDSPVGANDDLIVRFSDGGATPIRCSTQCTQVQVSGTLWLCGADGIGVPFTSDLRVAAFKADGSTAPDAGDRPAVTCIVGY